MTKARKVRRGPAKRKPRLEPSTTGVKVGIVAAMCSLTPRHVQRLVADGVMPRAERGKYNLAACVRAYIAHLQRSIDEAHAQATLQKADPGVSAERALKIRVERQREELKLAKERAGVITVPPRLSLFGNPGASGKCCCRAEPLRGSIPAPAPARRCGSGPRDGTEIETGLSRILDRRGWCATREGSSTAFSQPITNDLEEEGEAPPCRHTSGRELTTTRSRPAALASSAPPTPADGNGQRLVHSSSAPGRRAVSMSGSNRGSASRRSFDQSATDALGADRRRRGADRIPTSGDGPKSQGGLSRRRDRRRAGGPPGRAVLDTSSILRPGLRHRIHGIEMTIPRVHASRRHWLRIGCGPVLATYGASSLGHRC
jgi:hypothetical protein